MPTRNVSLTDEMDRFVADKVASGAYANASEVMRVALRNLDRDDREFEARMALLKAAVMEGVDCDPAEDEDAASVFAGLRKQVSEGSLGQEKEPAWPTSA